MKRQWQIRRQFQESADAVRRWDHAYQPLLPWRQPTAPRATPPRTTSPHLQAEGSHDYRH
jgi:hypothetical protein